MFTKHFGSDFAALEVDLIKHMQGLPYTDPVANQTHYVVLLDTTTAQLTGVTSSPAAVRKWREH